MHASRLKTNSGLLGRLAAGLALASMLTACGYKGPLYMPPPAPDETLTTPPAPAAPLGAQTPQADPATATTSPVSPQ